MLCVCVLILFMSGGTYSLKSISILYALTVFVRNYREEVAEEIYFNISFWSNCLAWGLNRALTSIEPTITAIRSI